MSKAQKNTLQYRLSGLYAITPRENSDSVVLKVQQLIAGGGRIVQYRNKDTGSDDYVSCAQRLQRLCVASGRLLIINDDVDLALEVGAAGVHLGQNDLNIELARKRLGDQAIIGITCHDQLELAIKAEEKGASYVAFGAFYNSPTKPDAVTAPLSLLEEARKRLELPICAIGGVTLDKAPGLINCGADMLAVVSDLFAAENIAQQAHAYTDLFKA